VISLKDISIVFQGKLPLKFSSEYQLFLANLAIIRSKFPESPIILGTWDGEDISGLHNIDYVFFLKDPGALGNFKNNSYSIKNNVNRQISCSSKILYEVRTQYTLKLRLDCEYIHMGFLDAYEQYGKTTGGSERIVVPNFFSIDPRMFEQMPFHVSDWFAFGPTSKLRKLWDAPLMTVEDSKYYDDQKYASHSTYFDRLFRSKFAIEQHITINYAKSLGYIVPSFHNDINVDVLRSHDQFVTRELLILNLDQFGIECRKYSNASKSSFQYFNCLNFLDWCLLNIKQDPLFVIDNEVHRLALKRARLKSIVRFFSVMANPWMKYIKIPFVKYFFSKFLRFVVKFN
jgi:WavE lipopolysaccharide synthesis